MLFKGTEMYKNRKNIKMQKYNYAANMIIFTTKDQT